ncbi:MAG TPA: arylesterase [Gemmatimonadaceae bacterium]|nr:arylesterase [Gemmatimonadaceae bacterium]
MVEVGNRKVVWLASCALLLAACTPRDRSGARVDTSRATPEADSSSVAESASRTILFIGTSLTAGYGLDADSAYPEHIQRMVDSARLRYVVVNAGQSGETSSALLHRLDWLLSKPFDVVVVETGANDGLRGIPIETMRANIEQIIERIRSTRPSARVVLAQMEAPPNLGTSYTRQFREVFPEIARRNQIILLPFLLQNVAGIRELNQSDGIHPNYPGERIVAQNVWRGLRPLLQ